MVFPRGVLRYPEGKATGETVLLPERGVGGQDRIGLVAGQYSWKGEWSQWRAEATPTSRRGRRNLILGKGVFEEPQVLPGQQRRRGRTFWFPQELVVRTAASCWAERPTLQTTTYGDSIPQPSGRFSGWLCCSCCPHVKEGLPNKLMASSSCPSLRL